MDSKTVGLGKGLVLGSFWSLTDEEIAIINEARKIEDDDEMHRTFSDSAEWLKSLTAEENDEHDRLFDAHEKAMQEFCESCPIGEVSAGKAPVCPACAKAIASGRMTCDCTNGCRLHAKNVTAESELRDFEDRHGVHRCVGCFHWGLEKPGWCDVRGDYVRARSVACANFHTETEDEMCRRTHSGPYETDAEREQRIKWESDHADLIESNRKARRLDLAKGYAELLNQGFVSAKDTYAIAKDYLKKAYAECPEAFANTPWKTFDELKNAVEA